MSEGFLPEKMVMVDCEMTGVNPSRDRLLQVAMVKIKLIRNQYRVDPNPFVGFLNSDLKPTRIFHHQYLTEVFKRCNESKESNESLRNGIKDWLGADWGVLTPCGDCVITDLEFLYSHNLLDRPGYDEDDNPILGTFHFEIFDLNAVKQIFRHKLGRKEQIEPFTEVKHEALADCYNQINELNHYLEILL